MFSQNIDVMMQEITNEFEKDILNTEKWDERYLRIVKEVEKWSTCYRRQVGAVITKDNRIITTGYNGAPSGTKNCLELNSCRRINIPSGQNAELCRAIHAEQNAILQAARLGISLKDATLYCSNKPCVICMKMIINSGITRVVYLEDYPDLYTDELIQESKIEVKQWKKKIE